MFCYHCGLPVPPGTKTFITIDAVPRVLCCTGCQAVAQAIVGNHLTEYYRHRDALPESPREALPVALEILGLFDHPKAQKNFVRAAGEHEREAALILEGITCAACVWLNEAHLRRQPGVTSVDINYATRRARVRWDTRVTKLSKLLEAVVAIGYRAHPYDVARSESLAQKERKTALWRLFVAGFGMMQVMMYAIPVYLAQTDSGSDMTSDIQQLMRWASLILTVPVVLYSAAPFFTNAWRDVTLRRLGMDVPVALGVGSAFAASLWATLSGRGEVYFDSVTMFVFFLLAGRYLEMMARQKAVRSVETLARAMPTLATRFVRWPEAACEQVAAAELRVGDVIQIAPGESIPADGEVIAGVSAADESLLTGESRPLPKVAGDELIGGSVNVNSPLTMRVLRLGQDTRLAAITRLMERAAAEKPHVVHMADRVAGRFVVAVLLLAVATALVWWQLDPAQALWVFVAVLVVSCPCALSLATPVALTVATGALAARGVLVTRGHAIETLAQANHFIFDKTGTLTLGQLTLIEMITCRSTPEAAIALAAGLEQGSEHPIGRALRQAANSIAPVANVRAVTGAGVLGVVDAIEWRLGRPDFVAGLHQKPLPLEIEAKVGAGDTVIALGSADGWQAFFRLGDDVRPEAAAAMVALRCAGVTLSIFSGDASAAVQRVGQALGIADVRGGMTPEEKHAAMTALQATGAVVAMVGDGVNDAPVLAKAQVSIAMGGGADLARAQADIVLLGNHLAALAPGVVLARRTVRVVRQNLLWAFTYNLTAIPLAMIGWVTPWMAGIGMSASSLLVVLNALRLQRGR
ncbi:heavy metal translocating P-type ATPase [Rugosibacter aromaticivorans]|uniref:heavy metal translocating P-type ATPase n=1 Tax=Rugosibacter aromaticivorans TaxID=1565605 RepID=UPI000B583BC8|nr:heavy metal translocating P-type ATPase [Rugosibacter aromaticivorans]ART35816.1 B122 [uncultured bacterium]